MVQSTPVGPVLVPLPALTPAPWNPRSIKDHRFQNLCRSIEADPEFLWRRPILAQADGTIYAGNMRYRAAQHLGMLEVPAIVEDVSDQLARERALRDNAQWGEWEEDELAALLGGRRGWPIPDAVVRWRLFGWEGTFMLEWDRGSESLAILVAKLARYENYWRGRGHRELLPGLGLRPRLAVVVETDERRQRLRRWLERRRSTLSTTVAVGRRGEVLRTPLAPVWWRSDRRARGSLFE